MRTGRFATLARTLALSALTGCGAAATSSSAKPPPPIGNHGEASTELDVVGVTVEDALAAADGAARTDRAALVAAADRTRDPDVAAALRYISAHPEVGNDGNLGDRTMVWVSASGVGSDRFGDEVDQARFNSTAFDELFDELRAEGSDPTPVVEAAMATGADSYFDADRLRETGALADAGDQAPVLLALAEIGWVHRGLMEEGTRVAARVWTSRDGVIVGIAIDATCQQLLNYVWVPDDGAPRRAGEFNRWDSEARQCQIMEGRATAGVALPAREVVDGAALVRRAAAHEAHSAVAFARLADELAALAAPADLVARARAAADDEVRHAAAMAALLGEPAPVLPVAPHERRTALDVARENAVEGCVHEAFAAVLAHVQAGAAIADHAPTYAAIADDEGGHADLAWDVAAWLEPRLSPGERAEVEAARAVAIAALPNIVTRQVARDRAAAPAAGLPTAAVTRALATRFAAALPARAAA